MGKTYSSTGFENQKTNPEIQEQEHQTSVAGSHCCLFCCDTFNDVVKKVSASVSDYTKTAGKDNMSLDVVAGAFKVAAKGLDGKLSMAFLILLVLTFAVFFWAIRTKNKADALDAKMQVWMPDEAEIEDIKTRFDNDFVRNVLSNISATETESVTVALEGILIESNESEVSFNFNKEGYKRLTNYESKQLAFYIGSQAFPEGFIIHQLRKHATVYDNYVRGYTETGEIKKKSPDEAEIAKKNLRWLLKEIATLSGNKKLRPKDEPVKVFAIEGGHIVINKGYSENSEKYKEL